MPTNACIDCDEIICICDDYEDNDSYEDDDYEENDYYEGDDSPDNYGRLGHDYKPSPIFFGNPRDNIFYGVELEVEVSSGSMRQEIQRIEKDMGGFAYMKEDGSLSHGFEIVTHPGSFEEQVKRFTKFFENGNKNLKSFDGGSCGCHIHISRKPLTGLTIPKMVSFVNNKDNYKYIRRLAQRKSSWAVIRGVSYKDMKIKRKKLDKYLGASLTGKYQAISLCYDETIEFRIFRGTLKKETFFRYLEFCQALIKFCWPSNRSLKDCLSKEKFMEYVALNKKTWPNLHNFHETKMKIVKPSEQPQPETEQITV